MKNLLVTGRSKSPLPSGIWWDRYSLLCIPIAFPGQNIGQRLDNMGVWSQIELTFRNYVSCRAIITILSGCAPDKQDLLLQTFLPVFIMRRALLCSQPLSFIKVSWFGWQYPAQYDFCCHKLSMMIDFNPRNLMVSIKGQAVNCCLGHYCLFGTSA